MAVTSWATITDVKNATGVDVDTVVLTVAKTSIEGVTGLIEEVERTDLTDRDRYWLKLAVCFQTAWIAAQPDYLERNDIMSANQDGQSATGANRDWLLLSPIARRYLKRLSWRGVRTLEAGRFIQGPTRVDVTSEAFDDSLPWRPL